MRLWVRGILAGLILGAGSTVAALAPTRADDLILPRCRPLPVATQQPTAAPAARAVPPAEGLSRLLGYPAAAPPGSPSSVSRAVDPTQNVAWDPVRLIGYTAVGLVADSLRDRLVLYGGVSAYQSVTGDVWVRPLSDAGTWTRLEVPAPLPSGRSGQVTVHDTARDRLLVYGGYCLDSCATVWALPLSGAPEWSRVTTDDAGPGSRTGARGIYDPVGDRLIVFGGYSDATDSLMNDVWSLSLAGTPAWTRLLPAGTPPSRRTEAAVVYDPAHRRMIVFGGSDSQDAYDYATGDVWALSLGDAPAWTRLQPAGDPPPGLFACAAALDTRRNRMLVFGGLDSLFSDPPHDETWALQLSDPVTWTLVAAAGTGPSARASARGVYDAARDRFVVHGGQSDDTWALSLGGVPTWTVLDSADAGAPWGRYLPSLAWDPLRRRALLFGGESMYAAEGSFYYYPSAELWDLSFDPRARWQQLARDSVPAARHGHTAVVDPADDRMIVFGGSAYPVTPLPYDLWELPLADGSRWRAMATEGTPPVGRWLHSAVFDAARRRMIVFGGYDGTSALGDTWVLDLSGTPAWTRLDVPGPAPSARWGHGAAWDAIGDRMIVFGGYDGTSALGDTWQLSFAGTPAWSLVPTTDHPSPRCVATTLLDPVHDCVVLVGGQDGSGTLVRDAWILPLADSTGWIPATATGASPDARWGATGGFASGADSLVYLLGATSSCGDYALGDAWAMTLTVATAGAVTLREVSAVAGGIALTWKADGLPGFSATVQRRTAETAWADLGAVAADAEGLLRYEDRTVARGGRYGYRLAWRDGSIVRTSAEVWQDMPLLPLLLRGATPNPALHGLRVSFWLPDRAAAKLELLDVAGRRVTSLGVGGLGPGPHEIDLDPKGAIPPGVYLLRLTRGHDVLTNRICVLR